MEQYIIKGGNPLVGEVVIGGAKNAALAINDFFPSEIYPVLYFCQTLYSYSLLFHE